MKFIIIHGAFGSPNENWFPDLKEELENMGQEVKVPKFPVDDWDEITKNGPNGSSKNQTLDNWLEVFEKTVLPQIEKNEKIVMIGHSLGPLFILHAVDKFDLNLDCAIFVSPFLDKLNRTWQIDFVNASFYKTDFEFEKLKKQLGDTYVLYSDADPYVSQQHSLLFSNALGSSTILVRKAGHMGSNLNEFPLVVNLCSTRVDLPLLQKYIAFRGMTKATDLTKKGKIESLVIAPEEALDEGVFHFRNLQKSGFCTYLSSFEFWDTTDKYYEDGRKAAQRIKDFTRVFVIENPVHLERKGLLNVMKKDFDAGINVMLCWANDIEDQVPYLDFGIWDEEYVCIVKYNKDNTTKPTDVELNSQSAEMKAALKWKAAILKKAVAVKHFEGDIKQFLTTEK